jgi:hypothetical protein
MSKQRYILENGSKKYVCPKCNKKAFVRYIDTETGEYLPEQYGRCDRESKCNYFNLPPLETLCFFVSFDAINNITEKAVLLKQGENENVIAKKAILEQLENGAYIAEYFLKDKKNTSKTPLKITYSETDYKYFQNGNTETFYSGKRNKCQPTIQPKQKEISFIDAEIFKASRNNYQYNNFVQYLLSIFGSAIVSELISRYHLGTSKYWNGATVFWQIDTHGKIRTGKIMLYNPHTGKRIKEPFNHINWVHTALKQPDFNLQQCLFGEHLLRLEKNKPVAIVESEKTAVISSVYFPNFIWLAVGSITNLNAEKCKVLAGRSVVLFPDLKAFDKWSAKAKELSNITNFVVSELLETSASDADRENGFDLADYLLKYNVSNFQFQPPKQDEKPEFEPATLQQNKDIQPDYLGKNGEKWHNLALNGTNIIELEQYFAEIQLPTSPINFDKCGTITDLKLFINSHLATVKTYNGNGIAEPYLNRLLNLKNILQHEH